jgi:hypothetical protein
MGLPAYIINRDELKQLIIKVLGETSITAELEGADLSGVEIDLDTAVIEEKLDALVEVISEQSISTNDLYMVVMDTLINMEMLHAMYDDSVTETTNKVTQILAEKLKIKQLLQQIFDYLNVNGRHKSVGLRSNVTASKAIFYLNYAFNQNVSVTSITIAQDKYNFEDYWEFKVNDKVIFKNVYTKYATEKKNFATFLKVSSSDTIQLNFYNHSGKQKTINYDIDFLIR